MDVDTYISINSPDWKKLDEISKKGSRGMHRLTGGEIAEAIALYQKVSAHLSEVQTRYSDLRLEAYLNSVVARAHSAIYSSKAQSFKGLISYFGGRYREALSRTAPLVLVAAVILLGLMAVVAFWVATSDEAQAGLLPGFARERIQRAGGGRPDIGVAPSALSTLILVNNVRVALFAFALGITLGAGTVWILVMNAVFIGSVAGGYHAAGLGAKFWALVLPHGFLELTAICIAAGAGMRMGWAIIDPGDRLRSTALVEEARDSVFVVLGVIPAFVMAAIIEGFVTGRTGLPALEIGIGALVAVLYLAFLVGWLRTKGDRNSLSEDTGRRPLLRSHPESRQ